MAVSLGPSGLTLDNFTVPNNAGQVIAQVKTVNKTGTAMLNGNINSSVEVDTNFRVNMTPFSTSSKILVTLCVNGGGTNGGTPRAIIQSSINSGAWNTISPVGDAASNRTRCHMVIGSLTGDDNQSHSHTITVLYSPNTTGSVNFRVLFGGDVSGNNFHWNRSINDPDNYLGTRCVSTLTLQEVLV